MAATLALKMLNFYLVSSSLYTFRVYSQVFIILFTEDTSLHLIKAKMTPTQSQIRLKSFIAGEF